MEHIPRRTIDELISRYTLEPGLRDVYVEGRGDVLLFDWFFKQLNCTSVVLFEINFIDIPNNLVAKYGLQSRCRDRVIALSIEFDRSLKQNIKYLSCIADSDFDFVLGKKHKSKYLFYTDYTSVDLYFCTSEILEKLFMLGIRKVPCDTQKLLSNLAYVLQEVFLIRATGEKLGWCLRWIPFTRCCELKNKLVVFGRDEFIKRFLISNRRYGAVQEFIDVYKELGTVKVESFKQRIRGLDYLELIGWYLSQIVGSGGHKYSDPEIIRSIIFPAMEAKSLAKEKLFKKLSRKYNG